MPPDDTRSERERRSAFDMRENTGFLIVNLRDGGEVALLFPDEINTSDRTNWEKGDVAGGLKPLSFGNAEPQTVTINDLCIDHTRTNRSVEPTIETLREWMRAEPGKGSPPDLQLITSGWTQRGILTELSIKRNFFTPEGVCIRAYLSLTFDELPMRGLQIEPTPKRRSGYSLSGRT